jgi:hypothetical protein
MNIQELERFSPGHWYYDVNDQLKRYVYRRSEQAFAAGDAARDAITDCAQLEARQQQIRTDFIASLGGLPPSDTPLEAQTVGVVEGNGFRIEKVIFQSRPHHYVTANLYIPEGVQPPNAAVLYLSGHYDQAKHQPEYQTVCQILVQAGLIVFAQDPIGQGERFAYYAPELKGPIIGCGTTEHDYAGAQCLPLGDSLARYFLHDAMRGLDYLCSRPEVDPERIGVTGSSGGGTQSCLMMLADPRIAAAAPATFLMNRESYLLAGGAQDAEQVWPGFSALGYDHEDVLLAMTPRPVLVLAVTSDFFPIEGTRRTVARCRRLWEMFGKPDAIDLVEDNSTHAYTRPLAKAAARFFAHHLMGTEGTIDEEKIAPFDPKRLWCTISGQVHGEIPDSISVHEANLERLKALEKQRLAIPAAERWERAVAWLRERVTQNRLPQDLNPRFYRRDRYDELSIEMAMWWSQEGIFNNGYAFRDFRQGDKDLPVTLAVWEEGTNCLAPHLDWIRKTCNEGRTVLVLDVTGSGGLAPRSITLGAPDAFYGMQHKMATDLIWLDDDFAALRTFDVLRSLEMIARWPGMDASDIRLYGAGRQSVYGQLAAALDTRIGPVEIVNGMGSYAEWVGSRYYDTRNIHSVILREALRYFDLPDLETE